MFSNRRLLLADDSTTIQKVIELTFGDEGLQVTSVGDGEEAVKQLEESPPDIVLADVFMPGRTGYEVCEHVKRSEHLRSIPVVLLVGTFEPFDEAEARRVGADDVLTKPFQSIRELVGKVGALLGNRSNNEQAASDEEQTLIAPPRVAENQEPQNRSGDEGTQNAFDTHRAPDDSPVTAFADQASGADDGMIEVTTAEEFEQGASASPPLSGATIPFTTSELAQAGLPKREARQDDSPKSEELFQAQPNALQSDEEFNGELNATAAPLPQHFSGGKSQVGDEMESFDFPPIESRMTQSERADEALLDLGDVAAPAHAAEADDFILDLADTNGGREAPALSAAPGAQASANDYPAFEMPAPFVPEIEHEMSTDYSSSQIDYSQEQPVASYDARSYSTQELNKEQLEERSGAASETIFASAQLESAVAEPEAINEHASSQREPETSAVPINLNQLSPEMIDKIARRAVEHLSDSVVREIAWEVVPQLAELLIKRRLDEENSNNM